MYNAITVIILGLSITTISHGHELYAGHDVVAKCDEIRNPKQWYKHKVYDDHEVFHNGYPYRVQVRHGDGSLTLQSYKTKKTLQISNWNATHWFAKINLQVTEEREKWNQAEVTNSFTIKRHIWSNTILVHEGLHKTFNRKTIWNDGKMVEIPDQDLWEKVIFWISKDESAQVEDFEKKEKLWGLTSVRVEEDQRILCRDDGEREKPANADGRRDESGIGRGDQDQIVQAEDESSTVQNGSQTVNMDALTNRTERTSMESDSSSGGRDQGEEAAGGRRRLLSSEQSKKNTSNGIFTKPSCAIIIIGFTIFMAFFD